MRNVVRLALLVLPGVFVGAFLMLAEDDLCWLKALGWPAPRRCNAPPPPPPPPPKPPVAASVAPPLRACALPWGGTLQSGWYIPAYVSPEGDAQGKCTAEARVCTDGVLSGSYTAPLCVPRVVEAAAPPAPPETRRLVANLAARKVTLFDRGAVVKSYRIAIGTPDSPTPTGKWKIHEIRKNPVWYVPASIREEMAAKNKPVVETVKPGPDNPLGTRFIRIGETSVGFHGTIRPDSIGRAASHGCMRMKNEDVEDLAARIAVGVPVELMYERVEIEAADGELRLTVHPDTYGRQKITWPQLEKRLATQKGYEIDPEKAELALRRATGKPVVIGWRPDNKR